MEGKQYTTKTCDDLTYFQEYVGMLIQKEPIEGLRVWSQRFTQYRENGQYRLCQRLLGGIKSSDLPLYGLAVIRYSEGWLYDRIDLWQESIAAYEASMKAFQTADIHVADIALLATIGSMYQDQGLWSKAEEIYKQALVVTERNQDREGRAAVLNNLGGLYLLQHEADQAIHCFYEAAQIFQETNNHYNYAATQAGLGSSYRDQGQFQEALDKYIEALSVYQKLENVHGIGTILASIALLYQHGKNIEEAACVYQQALAVFIQIGDQANITKTLGNIALIRQEQGDLEESLERRVSLRAAAMVERPLCGATANRYESFLKAVDAMGQLPRRMASSNLRFAHVWPFIQPARGRKGSRPDEPPAGNLYGTTPI